MSDGHESTVKAQFGPQARAYVESAVHSRGPDLQALEAIVSGTKATRALDVGTGGGHVAYLLAKYASAVSASDISREMLDAVTATAAERGLRNIETAEAPAESLPFADGSFDLLACRYSAHHWRDFDGGVREARRVSARGARAIFMDAFAPASPLLDTHLQAVELLRDTSHVRDYTLAQWADALGRASFVVERTHTWRVRMDFAVWTARMRTPEINVRAIRALQSAASAETRTHFGIEADGSFMLDTMLIEAVAA